MYVFARDAAAAWSQQAYLKASNSGASDWFGHGLALSGDGYTLAVGAPFEDGSAIGIGGNSNNSALDSGAAYVFAHNPAGAWAQQAYVKAPNSETLDELGSSVALSGDGFTLAVGALVEASAATGIGGDRNDNGASESGAVYLY